MASFFWADEALPKMPSVRSTDHILSVDRECLCLAKRECALSSVIVVASHEC